MKEKKVGVLISGTGSNLKALVDALVPIAWVGSNNPDAKGLDFAHKKHIHTFVEPKIKELERLLDETFMQEVEFLVLAGFMRVLSKEFVKKYPKRIINIHPSLLPAFKGTDAIRRAYDYGCKVMGVTIHYVNEKVDEGQIIAQEPLWIINTIGNHNAHHTNQVRYTYKEVEEKVHALEHSMYHKVVRDMLGIGGWG